MNYHEKMGILLTADLPTIGYVKKNYSGEYDYFSKFYKSNGINCPFARAAIKRIFDIEYSKHGDSLLRALEHNTWPSSFDKS